MFLGKFTRVSQDELKKFVLKLGFNFATKYEGQNLALVVLSTLINPYEEELSYELYKKGVKDVTLEEFEAYYISTLKPNSLLMSLKLSNNQERLISFLKSKAVDDELFLKLLKLYNWSGEGLFDNDNNRDVTLSFIERFYKRENFYNHRDIAHSPSTIFDIVLNTKNPTLLETMLKLPSISINTRGEEPWKPKNLKEFIAINPNINSNTKRFLVNLNSDRIFTLLALNPALSKDEQKEIYDKLEMQGKINLASNENLAKELFKRLLNEDTKVVETLLTYQKLEKSDLALIKKEYLPLLSNNLYLNSIKDELLFKDKELDFALCKNSAINSKEIEKLYQIYGKEIAFNISQNPNCPIKLLEEFYKEKDEKLTKNIAKNPNTPEYIIDELFNLNSNEINTYLAQNPNLKSEYIEYFKLDPKLLLLMSQVQNVKSKIINERV